MSIQKMSEVWKFSNHGGNLLLLELAIADHINREGLAWPSIKYLAKKTKLSERHIHRLLKQLEISGELIVLRDRRYNRYRIDLGGNKMPEDDKMSVDDEMSGGDKMTPIEKDDIRKSIGDSQIMGDDIQDLIPDKNVSIHDTDVTLIFNKLKKTKEESSLLLLNREFSSLEEVEVAASVNNKLKKEAELAWTKLLDVLRRENFAVYQKLAIYSDVCFQGEILLVHVTDNYSKAYLNDRFAALVSGMMIGIMNRKCPVQFQCD
jgi:hypothetical protein